jgi:hypothetical protein
MRFVDFLSFMPTNGVYVTWDQDRAMDMAVCAMVNKRPDIKIVTPSWLMERQFEKCEYSTIILDERIVFGDPREHLDNNMRNLLIEAMDRIKTFHASEGQ